MRGLLINNEPYFVGKDIATILGYARPQKAVKDLVEDEDRKTLKYKACPNLGLPLWKGNDYSDKTIINESGLYTLILSSKLPLAKEFRHWVTSEVLPIICKTGGYVNNEEMFVESYFPEMDEASKQFMVNSLVQIKEKINSSKSKKKKSLIRKRLLLT